MCKMFRIDRSGWTRLALHAPKLILSWHRVIVYIFAHTAIMPVPACCVSPAASNCNLVVGCFRMDQAPKVGDLGAQASFDSLNGDSDEDAFSEVTGISRRSASAWGSFVNLQGAERNVSRFFRRFIPSQTTAQTGDFSQITVSDLLKCGLLLCCSSSMQYVAVLCACIGTITSWTVQVVIPRAFSL